jgi:hypothetical protein
MKHRALIYFLLANLPLLLAATFFALAQGQPAMARSLDEKAQSMNGGRTYPTPTKTPVPTATPEPRTYPEPTPYPMANLIPPAAQPITEIEIPVVPGMPAQLQVPIPSMPGVIMTINLPAGVVEQDARLEVVNPEVSLYTQPRSSFFEIFGQAVDINLYDSSGHRLTLKKPITLIISYPEEFEAQILEDMKFWRMYWTHDGVHWDKLETAIDTQLNTLTASVDHLTIFAPVKLGFSTHIPLAGRRR